MIYTVGIADMKISTQHSDIIITYALGSCLGITIHDPVACVGAMLHIMLPTSSIDIQKAAQNPCMFVDTGVPKLFNDCYKFGARKERLVVTVAGGASPLSVSGNDHFQIGNRNFITLRKLLWHNGALLKAYDVGGTVARTMSLEIGTGKVVVKHSGGETKVINIDVEDCNVGRRN
ncbi:MAG: chemotaxis protein CheD [Candidatus Schekmanbacteria bacterium]|nr:chemotaxis protein CheD [Candidatus Schekmanbacteria bacterium]